MKKVFAGVEFKRQFSNTFPVNPKRKNIFVTNDTQIAMFQPLSLYGAALIKISHLSPAFSAANTRFHVIHPMNKFKADFSLTCCHFKTLEYGTHSTLQLFYAFSVICCCQHLHHHHRHFKSVNHCEKCCCYCWITFETCRSFPWVITLILWKLQSLHGSY